MFIFSEEFMKKIFNRQSLNLGNKVKVKSVRSGVDSKGVPYWKFYVPFTTVINGNSVVYKHLWCKVYGYPTVKEDEWVTITNILGYTSNCRHNNDGGMTVFEDLIVEIEKSKMERDYETDTD